MRSKSLINDIETIYDEVRHQLRVGYTLIQLWFVVCPTATRTDCRRCNGSVWTSRHVHVPGRQSDVHRDSVLYILQLLPNFPVFFFSQCLILEESPRCPAWFCKCPNLKKSGIVCCTSCCVSEKIVFALFEMKVQSVCSQKYSHDPLRLCTGWLGFQAIAASPGMERAISPVGSLHTLSYTRAQMSS